MILLLLIKINKPGPCVIFGSVMVNNVSICFVTGMLLCERAQYRRSICQQFPVTNKRSPERAKEGTFLISQLR